MLDFESPKVIRVADYSEWPLSISLPMFRAELLAQDLGRCHHELSFKKPTSKLAYAVANRGDSTVNFISLIWLTSSIWTFGKEEQYYIE